MKTTPWEVASDCARCHGESARVELFDPDGFAAGFGVPVDARCRLCGWHTVVDDAPGAGCPRCGGQLSAEHHAGAPCPTCAFTPPVRELRPPDDLTDPVAATAALARWAAEDGESDVSAFCRSAFGLDAAEVVAKLASREPIPSLFDVIDHLFPAQGAAHGVREGVVVLDARVAAAEVRPPPRPMDPRLPTRALVSVMLADGAILTDESAWIARWLVANGCPAVTDADLRVWRAWELGPAPTGALRDRIVDAMVEVAWRDRDPDAHEVRVITDLAGAWGVNPEALAARHLALEQRYSTPLTRLYRAMSGWVRTR